MTETNTQRFYRLQNEQLAREKEQVDKAAQEFIDRANALKQAAQELQRQADKLINQVQNNGQTK